MQKSVKVEVFDSLKSNNVMVSGWYSYNDNPNVKYGLLTGDTKGLDNERRVYNKKWMDPVIRIPSDNINRIHIKVRHRDRQLWFEHDYLYWDKDISIAWLRPGNLGSDTVNWFYNDGNWYYGGEKGEALIPSHKTTCGYIPASVGNGKRSSDNGGTVPNAGNTASGGQACTGSQLGENASLDELVNVLSRQAKDLVDGSDTVPTLPTEMEKNREGAFIRGIRPGRLNVERFVFPPNTSNYYIGNILLVDDNETFFSNTPTSLRFNPDQRKRIDIMPSVVIDDFSMLEKVIPTEINVKKATNQFLIKYKNWVKNNSFRLPEVASPKYYTFESEEAINIGGTIKGVSFDATLFKNARSITVVEFKQVLYSLSIDDSYRKASDFLQNITAAQLLSLCRKDGEAKAPALIETVYYGKSAYLCAICEDREGASFNIGEYIKFGKSGGSKSWKFQVIVNGGKDNLPDGYLDRDKMQTLVNAISAPITADDIETAVPIEFEASYLSLGRSNPVRLDIKPYYKRYVENILFKLTESNKGASMSAIIRWLEPRLDADNRWHYVFREEKKKWLDHTIRMSPWALTIEVKIDVAGAADKYDFNFFIPNIPLDLLRINEEGDCVMKCNISGTTAFDSKNVSISPMPSGCYISKSNNLFGVTNECSRFNTQREILQNFFRWCDYRTKNSGSMSVLGKERVDKSGKSRE